MKIIYNENPLKTKIILNNIERELFLYKIALEFIFDNGNDNEIINIIKTNFYNSKSLYCDFFEPYLSSLISGHRGDCTSTPMPCIKCYSENLLKINTIRGLPSGYIIDSNFEKSAESTLEYLQNHIPPPHNAYGPSYHDKWITTINWLEEYINVELNKKEVEIEMI